MLDKCCHAGPSRDETDPWRAARSGSSVPCRAVRPTPSQRPISLHVWAARVLWLVVVVVGGSGFGEALADHGRAVQLTATAALWAGWATVALTLAVPSALGLTLSRVLVPVGLVAALVALVDHGVSTGTVSAVVSAFLAAAVVAGGEYGQAMVQASAYGDEQRFLLRPPAAFYLPTAVSWAVLCAALTAGPLLLAARQWIVGGLLCAAAVAATWFLLPRFHRLTRRWVVLVPAGLVLHDHVVLAETAMFRAQEVVRARLALADTEAADLTGPAGGHAVEVTVSPTATVVLAGTRSQPGGRAIHLTAFLCAPTRPGRLLRAAGERRLPVG